MQADRGTGTSRNLELELPEELQKPLKDLSVWEAYLAGLMAIKPNDASWRDILVADKDGFRSDAARYALDKVCHSTI